MSTATMALSHPQIQRSPDRLGVASLPLIATSAGNRGRGKP